MNPRRRKNNLEFQQLRLSIRAMALLLFMMFSVIRTFAQNSVSADSSNRMTGTTGTTRKLFGGKITNSGYGGIILKFSRFNNQFAFMTGGRGACTINNK
jgi:hypothetical protein